MELNKIFPRELSQGQVNRTPLVIVGGTVEYHGPHCAYGCDTLIAEGLVAKLSEKKDIIIAPSIAYSPASWAVGNAQSGTVHISEDVFEAYLFEIFMCLLSAGNRNIYVVIHHQYEEENLKPMTLSYMKASQRAIMRYLEKTQGEGWWGSENYADYYENVGGGEDPFSWIKVIPAMSAAAQKETGYDHAGLYECSILMALYPEAVCLERLDDKKHWFTQSAAGATAELGQKMVEVSLRDLMQRIV